MSKQPPPASTASATGPCPTVIQIVGRPGTGSLPSTIAPPDHPRLTLKLYFKEKLQLKGNSYLSYANSVDPDQNAASLFESAVCQGRFYRP